MAMSNEAFDALVSRLEERSRRDPSGYKLRVLLLALAGYAYLVLMLSILIPLFLGTLASIAFLKILAVKIAIPIGIFVWLVLKAMWVKIPPPEGRALQREEAPALFALVDEPRRKLRAPQFHRILMTGDFNAAVVQVPGSACSGGIKIIS